MLDLSGWQVVALVLVATVSLVGGPWLGRALHRVVYRRVLLRRTRIDDRYLVRLEPPFGAAGIVLAWQVLVGLLALPAGVLAFCRNVGHIGLLLTLGWGAMRTIDTTAEQVMTRSTWIADQQMSVALLSLARRIAKLMLGVLVGVMILARMGYAIGPLLVMLAIGGASLALAAHRPLENVLAAYTLLGDHGIREGDHVTLDGGGTGTIEQIGLYSTSLRTPAGSQLIVPNRKLADAQIERAYPRSTTQPLGAVSVPPGSHAAPLA